MTKPYPSVVTLSPISPVSPAVLFLGAVGSLPRLRGLASVSGPFLAAVLAFAWGSPPAPLVQAPKSSAAFEEVYAGLPLPPSLPVRGSRWACPSWGPSPRLGLSRIGLSWPRGRGGELSVPGSCSACAIGEITPPQYALTSQSSIT